ncbi:MAG: hypothetical protein AAF787_14810, partial [Chloroflexota bacterium]
MSEHDPATDHIEARRQRNLRNITRMYYGSARLIGYGCIASVVTFMWGLQSLVILFYISVGAIVVGIVGLVVAYLFAVFEQIISRVERATA